MRKNVAGQVIGAQMNSRTDGLPIEVNSPPVTVFITGDNGTQTLGSVGSGLATHKGNGFWTYAPSQAETNFDHVAFTFEHPDAVIVTVQAYTTFPQTGDSFARVNTGIPNVAPGANGGLPTVNANNQIAGIAGTLSTLDGLDTAQDAQHAATQALINALNNLSQAQAQAASAAALVAFDPATATSLLARTLAAESYATAAAQATAAAAAAAIKNKTDQLAFTTPNQVDANVRSNNNSPVTGTGQTGDRWRAA